MEIDESTKVNKTRRSIHRVYYNIRKSSIYIKVGIDSEQVSQQFNEILFFEASTLDILIKKRTVFVE